MFDMTETLSTQTLSRENHFKRGTFARTHALAGSVLVCFCRSTVQSSLFRKHSQERIISTERHSVCSLFVCRMEQMAENDDFGPRKIESLESEVITSADIAKLKAKGFSTVDALALVARKTLL